MAVHKDLPDSQLHEPKGIVSATVGKVYVANGSGSGTWKLLTSTEVAVTMTDVKSGTTIADAGKVWTPDSLTDGTIVLRNLTPSDVGADASGAAATAESNAATYTDGQIAAEIIRADAAYDPFGSASSTLTSAQPYADARFNSTQRTAVDALTAIAVPSTATAEDCANAINAIIAALQA